MQLSYNLWPFKFILKWNHDTTHDIYLAWHLKGPFLVSLNVYYWEFLFWTWGFSFLTLTLYLLERETWASSTEAMKRWALSYRCHFTSNSLWNWSKYATDFLKYIKKKSLSRILNRQTLWVSTKTVSSTTLKWVGIRAWMIYWMADIISWYCSKTDVSILADIKKFGL